MTTKAIISKTHNTNTFYPDTFYRTGRTSVDHRTYVSIYGTYDFECKKYMSNIANDILHDEAFDEQCYKNILHNKQKGR